MGRLDFDADVIIVGGGPAGSALGTFLASDGHKVILLEKDIHPREHVGEALTPSTNVMFQKLGFLEKMNDAGFVRKMGLAWNGPRTAPWKFLEIRTSDYPFPGSPQPGSFNVERGEMDTMLLRHSFERGVKVLQGVGAQRVLFEDGRAVGVHVKVADGWERDLRAKYIVDATGRRCMLANQLKMRRRDQVMNQYSIWSWFDGVKALPERISGFTVFYFVGIPKAWCWHIPLRNDRCSMGVVVDKEQFRESGKDPEEYFYSLIAKNRTFSDAMENAERVRPWWVEGDYTYSSERMAGPGWLIVGDAARFVDPIFSSGVDVALYSAYYAYEAITEAWITGDESSAFRHYEKRIDGGVEVWYRFVNVFYRLQNLFTRFLTSPQWKEETVRALQGNPYDPETRARAERIFAAMEEAYSMVMADPTNVLRPWEDLREFAAIQVSKTIDGAAPVSN